MTVVHSAGQTQSAVELAVLRKAIDIQAAGALALLEAIPAPTPVDMQAADALASLEAVPTPPPAPVGTEGGFVDTWA